MKHKFKIIYTFEISGESEHDLEHYINLFFRENTLPLLRDLNNSDEKLFVKFRKLVKKPLNHYNKTMNKVISKRHLFPNRPHE